MFPLLLRPFSIAAAAVEEQSCVLFSIAALLLRPFSIAAAAVEVACPNRKIAHRNRKMVNFSIAALFYCGIKTYILYSKFLQFSD